MPRIIGFDGASSVENVQTVLEALEAAGLSPHVTVRLNGVEVGDAAQTPVAESDTIVVTPPEVKHG